MRSSRSILNPVGVPWLLCLFGVLSSHWSLVSAPHVSAAPVTTGPAADASERPNVILIVTDDQGYGDLGCHGNPVLRTPNMDALYAESIRLTDYHVSPTCSPTRAALLTGHWTNRTGVWHTIMGRSMLRENEVTAGEIFRQSGYATGMFGKWHLGDNYPYRPEDRGFGEVLRHGGGGVGQTPDYWDNAYFDGAYWRNGEVERAEGFCTDVFFDAAQQFIAEQADAGKPFFAYIATNAPHGPMHAPPEYSAPYREQPLPLANFYGMIANIDANLGELNTFLSERGLAENTILIFTTDNGTAMGAQTFNAGMRGAKGSEFDGGHRVPFFLRWPGGGLAGPRDVSRLTGHVDVVPTLIELCGLTAPENVVFDGQSLVPLLREEAEDWPDRILITDSQRVRDPIAWRKSAVMTDRWRLINGTQLFDMQVDPGQQRDVASGYPAVVERLRGAYERWWADLEPTFSQDAMIYLGDPKATEVRLTSHDWITDRMTPWNQAHIRSGMRGEANTGFWNVSVRRDGRYRFRLRRWPPEVKRSIDAGLPAGEAVPGQRAYRMTPGAALPIRKATISIGDRQRETDVSAGQEEAVFELRLQAGDTQLATRFWTADGVEYGAYYTVVEYLGGEDE